MKKSIEILIGAPLSGEEARFLHTLHDDLLGIGATILANFEAGRRQIDFLVVTSRYAALLELKNFSLPVFGEQNGSWSYETPAGVRSHYSGENPWQQAMGAKHSLSDEMAKYRKRHPNVPAPTGPKDFMQFDAFVCIFPAIHPRSHVTSGNHKVAIRSYGDVLSALQSNNIPTTWSRTDWALFAETHLHLSQTTLEGATDSRIRKAIESVRSYRERVRNVICTGLPPICATAVGANSGLGFVKELTEQVNFMLLGPSGSTKTFHLHHLAIDLASSENELPLLVEAKKYRGGDFWSLLRQSTAPFFLGDPRFLLEAAKRCGLRPVLLIDALNECAEDMLPDLFRGIQAFLIQFGGRCVLTSQVGIELPGDLASAVKHMPSLDPPNKRIIYAHHAGIEPTPELDYLCSTFNNGYDLVVAGRCHSSKVRANSRVELYDRYVKRSLPVHFAVQSALLRAIAAEMAESISFALDYNDFNRISERFLAQQHAPLTVLDDLCRSRLVDITADYFTFEHELLFDYFRAEELRRRLEINALTDELSKPKNQALIELIAPRLSNVSDLAQVISATTNSEILNQCLRGSWGVAAQTLVIEQCRSLLGLSIRDLSKISVTCSCVTDESGRTRLTGLDVKGHREWNPYDRLLCEVIALNVGHREIQAMFLELLDKTESTLIVAVRTAAENARFKVDRVWGEAIRLFGGTVRRNAVELPCLTILSGIRDAIIHRSAYQDGLPIRPQLLERVQAIPSSALCMPLLLEDLEHRNYVAGFEGVESEIVLRVARLAWDSQIYILCLGAIELLRSTLGHVWTKPELLQQTQKLLKSFDTDNIFINSALLETMASFGCFEPPVSVQDALSEMRRYISQEALDNPDIVELAKVESMSTSDLLAQMGYSCLSKIFEEVFLDAYSEAYSKLSREERFDLLCLAARSPQLGFATDWILRELSQYNDPHALPIYQRYATHIDSQSSFIQQDVACFGLSIEGMAKLTNRATFYDVNGPPDYLAWHTLGEILFWNFRDHFEHEHHADVIRELWARFTGTLALAAADVLYQLDHACWQLRDQAIVHNLILAFPNEVEPLLEYCLANRSSLTSYFGYGGRKNPEVVLFLIRCVEKIGKKTALPILRDMVDDSKIGKQAILAIQTIQRRSIGLSENTNIRD